MAGDARDDDRGHLLALEAILVAVILFTTAAYVALAPLPGQGTAYEEAQAASIASDVLAVLEGRPGKPPFDSLLHQYVTNATRGDVSELANYMNRTLPTGADFGIYLDNGEDLEVVYETGTPSGIVHSESIVFYPDWSYAMAFATMDRQPGAKTSTENVCVLGVCTPTLVATSVGTMRVKVVPVLHSYLDRQTASAKLVFDNGKNFTMTRGADGIFVAGSIPPESPSVPTGFDTPYDVSGDAAYLTSVTNHATSAPTRYGVNTTLPYSTVGGTVYRVHPSYLFDSTLQSFLESQPRVTTATPKAKPGGLVSVGYDFAGIPLPAGWSVYAREIHVYGPVLGNELVNQTLPALSGTWTWTVPRDALYGTYVVEVRLALTDGGLVQTVHDVTAFDVLRKGVDEPVPPVYRAVVAVWFPGLD